MEGIGDYAEEKDGPRKNCDEDDRQVIPEGLDVLELGGEVALEIVFDDEDAEEVGVAVGAEDIPGKRGEKKSEEGGGMKESEGVAPAFGEERPEKNGTAGEDDGGRAFG